MAISLGEKYGGIWRDMGGYVRILADITKMPTTRELPHPNRPPTGTQGPGAGRTAHGARPNRATRSSRLAVTR
eukprot:2360860-Prymnesium_polylepis.1